MLSIASIRKEKERVFLDTGLEIGKNKASSEKVKEFNGWKEEEDFAAFEIQIDFPFLDTLDTLDTFGGCRLSFKGCSDAAMQPLAPFIIGSCRCAFDSLQLAFPNPSEPPDYPSKLSSEFCESAMMMNPCTLTLLP